jgi:hypothetical protein
MLKFVNEVAVYNFEREYVRFVGIAENRPVVCRVTKEAVLSCLGRDHEQDDAGATELLAAFDRYRQLFEDIAAIEYAAGARTEVLIERFHLEQPIVAPLFGAIVSRAA